MHLCFTLVQHKISYGFLISVLPLSVICTFFLYKLICFSKKWVMKYFSFHAYHRSYFLSLKLIMFSFFPSRSSSSATLRTFLCSLMGFRPRCWRCFQPFAGDNMSINSGCVLVVKVIYLLEVARSLDVGESPSLKAVIFYSISKNKHVILHSSLKYS